MKLFWTACLEAYERCTFNPNEVDSIQSRADRIFKYSYWNY